MKSYLTVFLSCLVLFMTGCGVKIVPASDYFDKQPQIDLANAAAYGNTDKIKQLLASGVDVNLRGKSGMTPLIWSYLKRNKAGFQCLLENHADPNLQLENDPNIRGVAGSSVISFAAGNDDKWYLETTLRYGGNPNLYNPLEKRTPIFVSIEANQVENLKMLIAAKANLNAQEDKWGSTPIIYAGNLNFYDKAYVLLQAGADPAIKDTAGTTILFSISHNNISSDMPGYKWRTKVIELLRAKGIEVQDVKPAS